MLFGLTAATGLIDAVCYLGMGHVLVANMTGNIVFLGFALAGAKGFSIASFLVALGSFLVGAAAGGRFGVALGAQRPRWLTCVFGIQTVLAAAALVLAATIGLGPTGAARFGAIGVLGVGTGLQNATVRKLAIPDVTTTVLTMTLTGLAADSGLAGGHSSHQWRRVASVGAMLGGALIGGALMVNEGFTPSLAVLIGLLAAVTVGFAKFATAIPTDQPKGQPAKANQQS